MHRSHGPHNQMAAKIEKKIEHDKEIEYWEETKKIYIKDIHPFHSLS